MPIQWCAVASYRVEVAEVGLVGLEQVADGAEERSHLICDYPGCVGRLGNGIHRLVFIVFIGVLGPRGFSD